MGIGVASANLRQPFASRRASTVLGDDTSSRTRSEQSRVARSPPWAQTSSTILKFLGKLPPLLSVETGLSPEKAPDTIQVKGKHDDWDLVKGFTAQIEEQFSELMGEYNVE